MRRMPPITKFIIITNVGIDLSIFLAAWGDTGLILSIYETFGLVPSSFLAGAVWQPITSMFLHSPSFHFHLLINMIGIWSFGTFLEKNIGSVHYIWLYFVSGLSGALLVVIGPFLFGSMEATVRPTVGASGALMGLLGSMAVFHPRSSLLVFFFPVKARTAAIALGIGSLLLAIFDSNSAISHLGHLGGVLGGVLYSKLLLSSLSPSASSPGASSPKNSPRAGPTAYKKRTGREKNEQIFEQIFEQLHKSFREPLSKGQKSRHEKIINPRPEDLQEDDPSPNSPPKHLIYDPLTGRFYYK